MVFDLIAFHESTTNDGLLPVAPAPGGGHGYVVTGDDLEPKGDAYVLKAMMQSAAIANFIEGNFGHSGDNEPNWNRMANFVRDQTGAVIDPMGETYKMDGGEQMNCNQDHGANAQVANLILALAPSIIPIHIGNAPKNLPVGLKWITATGVTAAIANTWSPDVATYTYIFNSKKTYAIYGVAGFSTTGYAFRIDPQSLDKTFRPGWMLGDTNITCQALYTEVPMYIFNGNAPPQFQKLCSATDSSATRYFLLIKEM